MAAPLGAPLGVVRVVLSARTDLVAGTTEQAEQCIGTNFLTISVHICKYHATFKGVVLSSPTAWMTPYLLSVGISTLQPYRLTRDHQFVCLYGVQLVDDQLTDEPHGVEDDGSMMVLLSLLGPSCRCAVKFQL
ncbi:hypothetical protein SODALDRAFT_355485 [Sodiomyces alkalinus F11]|uniref:Uncharacterized protein n=1 Tax=Sodiomyces alkalinus (strain CBS 110278 / VKM F-3762 / F11) TaxID=1314773 RepID=A0A3N2Q922_SODAK|nr:hypothetical protein SODALDRAFT_355485 [Sodiomyces alkalinus F11]ROT43279.1 hypothetical protein SODALDRAFT_355485 [Sodiomyces alkalinus F11]